MEPWGTPELQGGGSDSLDLKLCLPTSQCHYYFAESSVCSHSSGRTDRCAPPGAPAADDGG